MSTILDALKKVERERQPAHGPLLDMAPPEITPRRRVPIGVVAACATLGLAAGVGFGIWRSTAPVEIAVLPAAPPDTDAPPQAEVARGTHRSAPIARAPKEHQVPPAAGGQQPEAGSRAAGPQSERPSVPAAAGQQPETGRAMPAGPAARQPPEGASERAVVPPSDAQLEQVASAPEAQQAAPAAPAAMNALPEARALPEGSALEPSPFAPRRGAPADAPAALPVPLDARAALPAPATAPPAVADQVDTDVAAVEPPETEEVLDAEEEPAPPVPPPPQEKFIDTGRSPKGQPNVSLSFLQWSADPDRRFAFVSIEGGPSQRVREGDVAAGLTVAAITPHGVRFKHEATVFTITPRH